VVLADPVRRTRPPLPPLSRHKASFTVYGHVPLRVCAWQVWSYDFAEHGSGATPTFPAADYPYAPSYMDGLAATGRLVSAVV
jgi:hypothetical protein